MNKQEFMQELEKGLAGVTPDERVAAIQYYNEYFDDAGPEQEADVISELGSPAKVAADIRAASGDEAGTGWTPPEKTTVPVPQPNLSRANTTYPPPIYQPNAATPPQNNDSTVKVVLIIVLVVLFSPALAGIFGTLLGLVITLFVLMLIPLIIGIALAIAGVAVFVSSLFAFSVSPVTGITLLGAGLFVLGLGLLCCYGGILMLVKGIPAIVRGIASLFGKLFHRPVKKEA